MLKDRQIQSAIKAVQTETILNDGAGGRGTGSLKLVIRRLADSSVSAVWFGSWKRDGKRHKKQLGRYPELSLDGARDAFRERVKTVLRDGHNPKTKAERHVRPTVENLFRSYIDSLKARSAPSAYNAEQLLLTGTVNAADALGRDTPAGDVTPGDVTAHLRSFFKRGSRRQADACRTWISAAYRFGIMAENDYTNASPFDWGIKINPAAMVAKDTAASVARERNLAPHELNQLWNGLDAHFFPDTADAMRLLICCGQRVRETLRSEGRDFDLEARLWNMPAHKTKGGKRPHCFPIPELAVEVVRELKRRHGDGYLFPGRTGSQNPTLSDAALSHAVKRWLAARDMPAFIPKDIRRTWKTLTAEAGIDRFTRDLIQQHAQNDTGSKHYDRADYMPQMRQAMQTWNDWLAGVIQSPNG